MGPIPPPRRSRTGLWVALAVVGVLLVVGVVVVLVLVLGGDDEEPTGGGGDDGDPAAVVREVVDAAADDDCAALEPLVTEEALQADPCESTEWELLASGSTTADVGEAEIDGDAATVPVVFEGEEGDSDYEFTLERDGEDWRVATYSPAGEAVDPSEDPSEDPTDDSGAPAGDPAEVVEAYLDALVGGRCTEADDLVTEDFVSTNGTCESQQGAPGIDGIDVEVGDATVDGAQAEVPSTLAVDGVEIGQVFTLVQDEGRWLIDDVEIDTSTLPSGPPSSPGPTG